MSSSKEKEKENIHIDISDNFPVDKALKKFKRMCDTYGIIKEYRKRESYTKPSVKDREKKEAAEKRRRKAIMKNMKFSRKI